MQARTANRKTMQPLRAVQPTIVCDVCHGSTFVSVWVDGPRGPGFTENATCPECNGTGSIKAAVLQWRLRGRDCRKVREDMRRTIIEQAYLMHVQVAYVDRMERGAEDPKPLMRYWGLQ